MCSLLQFNLVGSGCSDLRVFYCRSSTVMAGEGEQQNVNEGQEGGAEDEGEDEGYDGGDEDEDEEGDEGEAGVGDEGGADAGAGVEAGGGGELSIPEGRCTRCKESKVWRIHLRQCGHFICVACALVYLKYWIQVMSKARIKCPKRECPRRIHENDIDALLDRENTDLNVFMKMEHREWLLHRHRKDTIYYAFGGNVRQCPLCKSLYTEFDGCHYVQCVNLRCNQFFCWECEQPTDSIQHFSMGKCKIGYDDIYKISYIIRFMVFTEGCILILCFPMALAMIYVLFPLYVLFSMAILGVDKVRSVMRRQHLHPAAITATALLLFPVALILSLPLAIGSLILAFYIGGFYVICAIIKSIPVISKVCDAVDMLMLFTSCVGMDDWRGLIHDSKEAAREKQVAVKQEELELSEYLPGEEPKFKPAVLEEKKGEGLLARSPVGGILKSPVAVAVQNSPIGAIVGAPLKLLAKLSPSSPDAAQQEQQQQ